MIVLLVLRNYGASMWSRAGIINFWSGDPVPLRQQCDDVLLSYVVSQMPA